ncbi:oligosaccharide flippase family protein [Zunongwangia sp. F363]|uniref:Oligosaccharide flippase family protein n=1 Tax=Autumnicola tepida TaxID=3075595 RepID=A0ABU3C7I4_9FLAO|nr:oligosaccharide flippase family protein [Zunongwangia sp. F363]MDT0642305.1 oligosaccharide flippase family protein [Zunongwangia sp. F363]
MESDNKNLLPSNRKSAVKWNLMLQYAGLAIGMIKGFFIVPIYFNFIDSEDYGYWLATGSLLVWINIVDPGAGSVLQQKVGYAYGTRNLQVLKRLIGSGILIGSLICTIALILSFIFSFFIPDLIGFENYHKEEVLVRAFNIGAIGACFSLITSVIRGVNYGMQKTKGPGIIEIFASLIGITVNITMLYNGYGLYSIAMMLLINGVLTCIGNLIYLQYVTRKHDLSINYSLNKTLPLFKEFTYTFFSRLVNTLAGNLDLIIIARFIGAEFVTIVEITRRPFKIVEGIVYKPAVAMAPAVSHLHGENNKEKLNKLLMKFFHFLTWAYGFIIAGFLLFNKDLITLWVGADKFAGIVLSLFICVGVAMKGYFASLGNINFALGNIKGTSLIIVVQNLLYAAFITIAAIYYSLVGIIVALIPALLFTGGWYHLKSLYEDKVFSREDVTKFVFNVLLVSVVCGIAFHAGKIVQANTWFELIVFAGLFALVFLLIFYLLSKDFRREIGIWYNKINLRFRAV